jgi:NAD(P)-dependent dehydrogenase (short-subunit alcohol dehydrogenase family)
MAKEPRRLAGKIVVITGGGRGIGRALAHALVAEGARVAIGDLDAPVAQRTAEELGGGTLALALDVTDSAGFTAFLDEVERRVGPIDVLVNNAGIMPVGGLAEEADAMAIRQLEVNLHAVIHGTKEAIRRMRPRGSGHIVNIASQAGKAGLPGGATYCATKHAVVGLSEAVRLENVNTGIEVSCVMPAVVNTELGSGLPETRAIKVLQPEDVAEAIVAALERPKFDVFVPRESIGIYKVMNLLPRGARESIGRLLKADKVLAEADPQVRASYEDRAAHSEPALDPDRVESESETAAT